MPRSTNPVLTRTDFGADVAGSFGTAAAAPMTLAGTVRKTLLLLAVALAGGAFAWFGLASNPALAGAAGIILLASVPVGVGLAWYTTRHPEQAHVTGPIYAAVQGFVLGAISLFVGAEAQGIPLMAAALTVATFVVMLTLYRTRVIVVTEKLRAVVVGATAAIMIFYLLAWVASFWNMAPPFIWGGGWIGIGFSLFVVALAAFNLVLDFDLIEEGIGRAPAMMEWAAAFGLIVTILWLYVELLRLLRKLRR